METPQAGSLVNLQEWVSKPLSLDFNVATNSVNSWARCWKKAITSSSPLQCLQKCLKRGRAHEQTDRQTETERSSERRKKWEKKIGAGRAIFYLFYSVFLFLLLLLVVFCFELFCFVFFFFKDIWLSFLLALFFRSNPPPSLSPSLLQQVENQLRLITGLRLSCVCYFLFPLVCWGFVWGFITFHLTFFCCNFRFQDFLKLLWFLFFEGACGRWRGSLPTLLLMALLRLRL